MYKKQMKFQKIICYLVLIASALVFVYSLGMLTDLYESLYVMVPDPSDIESAYVTGAGIFYEMQDFNRSLTVAGLVLILLAAFMMVMNTHIRRKYYIGNYISIAIMTIASLGVSVWGLVTVSSFKNEYLNNVDFESLAMWSEVWKSRYTDSTLWFDVSYCVFGLLIVSVCLLVYNLIWKIRVTKAENLLIAEGKEGN